MFTHSVFARTTVGNETSLVLMNTTEEETDHPMDSAIRRCDDEARFAVRDHKAADAYVYKVDGEVEYMVSKYFYAYPNTTDREPVRRGR